MAKAFCLFHLCFASHEENLCRVEQDYVRLINIIATEAHAQDSQVRAFACMSDHVHIVVNTRDPEMLLSRIRERYTKYFNVKYHRAGPFVADEKIVSVSGLYHEKAVYSYVIRNPKHHYTADSQLAYPYSSGRYYFPNGYGYRAPENFVSRRQAQISRRVEFPASWRVLPNGLLNPADWLDIQNVEANFGTFRKFTYNTICRMTSEEWLKEQEKDEQYMAHPSAGGQDATFQKQAPISLETIEPAFISSAERMRINEYSEFRPVTVLDDAVCALIDNVFVPQYGKQSYAQLSRSEKTAVANALRYEHGILSLKQIKRCLAM